MGPRSRRAAATVTPDDDAAIAADRARLLELVAQGIAHEGKNPLHNMMLHVQLMAEKIAEPGRGGSPLERHLGSLRDGIAKVDALLRAFGELANPEHMQADLGATLARALLLFGYEARRANVELVAGAAAAWAVVSDPRALNDLVAHLLLAAIELANGGGRVHAGVARDGSRTRLELRVEGGVARRDEADLHLAAVRRLLDRAAGELSVDAPAGAGARLSLSFVHPR